MAHWRTMTDNSRIGAWDLLDDNGQARDRVAEIVKVEAETLKGTGKIKASRKPVLYFKGTEKSLIAGATICKAISQMYGPNTSAWIGKRVCLYATTTSSADGEVECVRVRPQIPRGKAEPVPSRPVDEAMRQRQVDAAEARAEADERAALQTERPAPGGE